MNRFLKTLLVFGVLFLGGCSQFADTGQKTGSSLKDTVQVSEVPEFDGETPYIEINGNIPEFTEEQKKSTEVTEIYSELDELGRCRDAYANLHISNMPTEDRESIGMIKPTGWVTSKYDFVDGKYLYNRCHLVGFQLAGENANEKNLITGTRYMNVDGMLPFENKVAEYLRDSGNHVLYRVTPVFYGEELVARGVQIEAYSVEDKGRGIQFNVYCYNNQPGVTIDYMTGKNQLSSETNSSISDNSEQKATYVLNTNSRKFHKEDCDNASKISEKNKVVRKTTKAELISEGYEGAKCCTD